MTLTDEHICDETRVLRDREEHSLTVSVDGLTVQSSIRVIQSRRRQLETSEGTTQTAALTTQ